MTAGLSDRRFLRRLGIALLCVVAAGLLVSPAGSSTRGDYERQVAQWCRELESVERAERTSPGSGGAAIDRLHSAVPSEISVTTHNRQTINVDLRWLKSDLKRAASRKGRARTEVVADIAGRLKAMQVASNLENSGDTIQTAHARSVLKNVLAGQEYRRSFIEEAIYKLQRAILNLLTRVNVSESTVNIIGWGILILVILVFVALLVYFVLRLIDSRALLTRSEDTPPKRSRKTARQSLESLLAAAETSADEHRYRDALRHIYLAAIYLMDRAKLITYSDGVTNWEYMRALRGNSRNAEADIFQDMTLLFDQLVYGKREVSERDYRRILNNFRTLEGLV